MSPEMADAMRYAPSGACVHRGIPFDSEAMVLMTDAAVTIPLPQVQARWVVFSHTADLTPVNQGIDQILNLGFFEVPDFRPVPIEHAADYVFVYSDGAEERVPVWRRHQIAAFTGFMGEGCFQAAAHIKPKLMRSGRNDIIEHQLWGLQQARDQARNRASLAQLDLGVAKSAPRATDRRGAAGTGERRDSGFRHQHHDGQ